jgi:hypothetical protein
VKRLACAALAVGLWACGGKKQPAPPQVIPVPIATVAPTLDVDAPPVERDPPQRLPSRPRLQLTLRSTPSGASAILDGRLIGTTPLRWVIEDDGKLREFRFELAGHAPWRLRFAPSRDGVIHATMEPSAALAPDAG